MSDTYQQKYDKLLLRCQVQDEQTQYWRHEAEFWRSKAEQLETDLDITQNIVGVQQSESQSQLSRLNKSTEHVRELERKVQEYGKQVDEHAAFYQHSIINLKDVCDRLNDERTYRSEMVDKLEMQKKHNLTLLKEISKKKTEHEDFRKSIPRLTKWGLVVETIYLANVNLRFKIDGVYYDVEDVWCHLSNDKRVHFKTVMLRFIIAGMSMINDD